MISKQTGKKQCVGYASTCPSHVHWDQVGKDSAKTGH